MLTLIKNLKWKRIAATLNQEGQPVTFFSRTLNPNEIKHAVEKEAASIVEALQK